MRIFSNLIEAYNEIQRDLVEMGTEVHPETMQDKIVKDNEDFITKEIQGYSYCITSNSSIEEDFISLGGNMDYVDQEHRDRISNEYKNPGKSWELRKEVWEPFLHNGKFSYTYNSRFREQLPIIIEELKRNPNSRQAVLTMFNSTKDLENLGGKVRIPCSLTYQFLIRGGVVEVIYSMRSCDIFTHMLYDIILTMLLQSYIAGCLGRESGKFIHQIGSLHAYRKDYQPRGIF